MFLYYNVILKCLKKHFIKGKTKLLSSVEVKSICLCSVPNVLFRSLRKSPYPRPGGPMSYIPTAIDLLLKKEFDIHRLNETVHPYCEDHSLSLIPFKHDNIEEWQNNRKGIGIITNTNLIIYGAIDDCWRDDNNTL